MCSNIRSQAAQAQAKAQAKCFKLANESAECNTIPIKL